MNSIVLSRKQIAQLADFINEYPNEDVITLTIANASGIGYNMSATVKYAADTREDCRDITDYNLW